jgi:DNA-binding LytR/AlgR family response regulator
MTAPDAPVPAAEHRPLRILVVEDNPLHGQALRMGLRQLGYTVLGVAATADEARRLFHADPPDVLVLDINLALDEETDDAATTDEADGITLAAELRRTHATPLIFLTSLADDATFRRAQQVAPAAFLIKPFEAATLRRALELAVVRAAGLPSDQGAAAESTAADAADAAASTVMGVLSGAIFVRHAGRLEYVRLADVTHLNADRSHCELCLTGGTRYALRVALSEVEARLPPAQFVRVHRSHLVAWAAIEFVDPVAMEVCLRSGVRLPLSRSYRDHLLGALPQLG